jgi:hypothetical protein
MGGVPARVAVGFTQGRRDVATGRWLVSDLDAHAWVEVWFPRYGWVKFDPTPAADPALGGISPTAAGAATAGTAGGAHSSKRNVRAASAGSHATGAPGQSGASTWAAVASASVVGLGLLVLLLVATRPLRSTEGLVSELERALARTGRPLATPGTLAGLEQKLRSSPEARGYVRALRLDRFGGSQEAPTLAQRRALRRELAFGLGPLGRLRALWALPPRRRRPHHGEGEAAHTAATPDA